MRLASISRLTAEILPAPVRHAIRSSTDQKTFSVTYLPAIAPRRRRTNTSVSSEIANMPSKGFLGTIIAYDMFGYSTKKERAAARAAARAAVWTSNSKSSSDGNYMTVCPALAQLTELPSFTSSIRGQPRKRFPKVLNNAFGP